MTSPLTPQTKNRILAELVQNTGADREIALRLLQEHNWQLQATYKRIEQLCIDSKRKGSAMQNDPSKRGAPVSEQHAGPMPRTLYNQRGGGAYPPGSTNIGVGRAAGSSVFTSRPGYEAIPIHRPSTAVPKFPLHDNYHDQRSRSQIDTSSRPGDRIVPIQVERGPAVKLPPPMIPQQQHQASRVSEPQPQAPRQYPQPQVAQQHQQHPTQQHPTQQRPTQPHPTQQYPTQQYQTQPHPTQQYQTQQQHPTQQYQTQQPHPTHPHQTQQQPTQQQPTQQHRVLPTPQPDQGFRVPQGHLQRQAKVQESMPKSLEEQRSQQTSTTSSQVEKDKEAGSSTTTTTGSGGDHTPKLKRGISNIMENVSLVSEARSSVLHDIEEDSHDHMYLLTFLLPDLTVYSEDFRAYLEKDLIETSTLVSLEQAGRLNWWAEMRIAQRLLPMATSGDGNCLLHAASLAMWGIHDRQLILRNALYAKMTSRLYKDHLYRRWRWQTNISNKESGLVLSEAEWQAEWENLLKLASPTPRTFPELSKRNSCCDSVVTHSSTSSDPVVYESLEEFHVFVLAHVLQRPIIIVADTLLKDSGGEALAPIPFGGIYLPLEYGARSCYRSPLLLTYDAAHFSALVPMEHDASPEEKPCTPAAIPLVDPNFRLLPLHFHIDPGASYDWNKAGGNKKVPELSTEDKLNLLQQFMNVEKLQIPVLDADYDSDKMSCGSCESDDSVGCVGNKEKKKDSRTHSVAKQFGSIGKSMGKKLKKNFGSIGKAMKNIGDPDKIRRQSVGSVITQSTKVIATIGTDVGRDRVWCARLSVSRTKMQQELVKNYLHTSEQRFEKDRDLWRKKNEEIRNRVSTHSNGSTVVCVTPGCQMFGTAESAYLCSKCFTQQKQEAIDKEKQKGGQFVYNTFPGRNKGGEETIVKYGNSKFYTGAEDPPPSCPAPEDARLSVLATMDRLQSRSVGDVSYAGGPGHPRNDRTPSPDYDNVDYKLTGSPGSTYIAASQTSGRPVSSVVQPTARSNPVTSAAEGDQGHRPQSFPGNKCKTDGCDFFGSADHDHLCSRCYKQRQSTLQGEPGNHTRL